MSTANRSRLFCRQWVTKKGDHRGGREFTKNALYKLLTNITYIGKPRRRDTPKGRGRHVMRSRV
ncbi:MAG: hypothetical protein FJ308_18700 [Planctomycetes bacterium]|nr:hypothetical protein [Planctomycetota bacterium]